jgi:anthrone oxygenase-like protein
MTDRSLRLTLFVHVFLFALVVGVFWGTWFSLSRSMSSITPSTFLEVGHTMIDNLGGAMAVLMPMTLISALPVLFMLYRLHRRASFSLIIVGVALLVVALVITLSVNVPIDYAINRWTVDTLPSDWTSIRNRWEVYHAARTFVSLAGFGSALAAVLWSGALGKRIRPVTPSHSEAG